MSLCCRIDICGIEKFFIWDFCSLKKRNNWEYTCHPKLLLYASLHSLRKFVRRTWRWQNVSSYNLLFCFDQCFVNFNSLQLHFEQFEVKRSPLSFILSLCFHIIFQNITALPIVESHKWRFLFHMFLKSHTTISDFHWLLFSSICTALSFHRRMFCILASGIPRNVYNLVLYSLEDWTQILCTLSVK